MNTLAELHERWSQDPEYREAYEQLGPEYEVARALIEARTRAGLTQAELAARLKTTQSAVSRLESGRTLEKVARATGTRLRIQFDREGGAIDVGKRIATSGSVLSLSIARIAVVIVLSLVGLGCATVTVNKVPTPSQYVTWSDEMQTSADNMEGFRFYLPRPFIHVYESFPVRADILLAEGVVSADGRFVVIRRMWDETGDVKYDAQFRDKIEIDTRYIKPEAKKENEENEEDVDSPQPDLGESKPLQPPQSQVEDIPTVEGRRVVVGRDRRAITNDNSAYAYQPLRANMDIVYLPDFDEQYVISSRSGLGDAEFLVNFGQGWSLQGFNSLADNSQLNDRIFSLIDSASRIAQSAAVAAAGLPPIPSQLPGTTAVTPQSGAPANFVEGSRVSLKIVILYYAAKGIYPVIKPRELQQRLVQTKGVSDSSWFDLDSPDNTLSIFDDEAIGSAQKAITGETGRFTVPRYPYQYISFNTFRYMAIETLTPGANPFGTLYDKTGTAGDPGDRILGKPLDAIPALPSSVDALTLNDPSKLDLAALLENQSFVLSGVTYTVLKDPPSQWDSDRAVVYLRESGSGTVQEAEIISELGKIINKEQEIVREYQIDIGNIYELTTIDKSDKSETVAVSISLERANVVEGEEGVFTVALSNEVTTETTAEWRLIDDGTTPGEDYEVPASTKTLTFAPNGGTPHQIRIATEDDGVVETNENLTVEIELADSSGDVAAATLTVEDNDSAQVSISVDRSEVSEGDKPEFTVKLSRPVASVVSVSVSVASQTTALDGNDYTFDERLPTKISFDPYGTIKTLTASIIKVGHGIPDKTLSLALSTDLDRPLPDNVTIDNKLATVTLKSKDPP